MKTAQVYEALKHLAEQLNITVLEQNLKHPGMHAKSGLCRVKGKQLFVMDKKAPVREKVALLRDCLRTMPHEDVYVVPAIRDLLRRESGSIIQKPKPVSEREGVSE